MRPRAADIFPAEDLHLLEEVRHCLANTDITHLGSAVLTSHIISEAVADVFDLKCYHGAYFSKRHKHSWVTTRNGHIIDVYPVGVVIEASPPVIAPQLVLADGNTAPKLHKVMLDERIRRHYTAMLADSSFRLAVSMVSRHLRQHRNALYMQRLNGHKEPREDSEPREE